MLATIPAHADPDDFDPLLDDQPARQTPADSRERYEPAALNAAGFRVGGGFSIYAGKVKSFLTQFESRLLRGTRYGIPIEFGYRSARDLQFGLTTMLGFGRTWREEKQVEVHTLDLAIEPKLVSHFVDCETWGLYGGGAVSAYLFDLAKDGLSQAGLGPALVVGTEIRLDRHSAIYFEVSGTYLHDFLAFRYEEPSEDELEDDPFAQPEKIEGKWDTIVRFALGYRLAGF